MATRKAKPATPPLKVPPADDIERYADGEPIATELSPEQLARFPSGPAPAGDPIVDPPSAPIEFLDTRAEIQKELTALLGLSFSAKRHVFELRRLIFGDGNCAD